MAFTADCNAPSPLLPPLSLSAFSIDIFYIVLVAVLQLYCSSCRHTHDAIQSCALHTVLPLGDNATKETARDEKRCPKHKNQPLLLFCRQCEVSWGALSVYCVCVCVFA